MNNFLASTLTLTFLALCACQPRQQKAQFSGEYYDWTITEAAESTWNFDYNKTLVTKFFMSSRNGEGDLDKVYLTFQEALETIKKLDNITLGLPKIVYLVGWQYNGHDSQYPSWHQANEALKRAQDPDAWASLNWLMQEAKQYNTTVSLHINMIDAFEDSHLWDEYMAKDIIAKDSLGNPIPGEVFWGMPSYQLSYKQEWDLGYSQKRIDELLALLPALKEAGTIHIDAFHSIRPNGVGELISPYLGYSIEEEMEAQRKLYRYWRSKGIDVTNEAGIYWLREDPFLGLQGMSWHFNELTFQEQEWKGKPENFYQLPAELAAYTPMHSEGEIMNNKEDLSSLVEQFATNVVPWYYRRNKEVSKFSEVIITEDLMIAPVLWKKETVLAFSKTSDQNLNYRLPSIWGKIESVNISELDQEGLHNTKVIEAKPANKGSLILLPLKAGTVYVIEAL